MAFKKLIYNNLIEIEQIFETILAVQSHCKNAKCYHKGLLIFNYKFRQENFYWETEKNSIKVCQVESLKKQILLRVPRIEIS